VNVPLAERKVVDDTFEGLYLKALKGQLTPRLKRRLAELGLDLDQKLKPTYPHALWVQALTVTAEELMPGVRLPDAFERLGSQVVVGYFDTFIGSALKQLLKAIGVRRALERMTANFSSSNNYTRATVRDAGPNYAEVWMNELTLTQYNALGILKTGLGLIGARDVDVELTEQNDEGCVYVIRWS